MTDSTRKVVLITGASSGIGRACATHLARLGHQVFGTSRRADLADADNGFHMVQMDVTDETSVARGVAHVLAQAGRLDVVVNNAGWGIAGAIEDTTMEEAQALFETNFFGVMRVCRAVLPIMRQQGRGLIINIGSLGGRIAVPFQGMYTATKFALEGFTETLRMEVRPFSIRVSIIEPGDLATGFTANRRLVAACNDDSCYRNAVRAVMKVVETDETNGSNPELVARLVERIIRSPSPRLRYTVGMLFQRVAAFLKLFLPASFVEWAVMKYYRLS